MAKKLVFSPDANRKFYSKRQQKWIYYHLFLIDEWANVKEGLILEENNDYIVVLMPDLKIEIAPNQYKIVNQFKMRKNTVYFEKFCQKI